MEKREFSGGGGSEITRQFGGCNVGKREFVLTVDETAAVEAIYAAAAAAREALMSARLAQRHGVYVCVCVRETETEGWRGEGEGGGRAVSERCRCLLVLRSDIACVCV